MQPGPLDTLKGYNDMCNNTIFTCIRVTTCWDEQIVKLEYIQFDNWLVNVNF